MDATPQDLHNTTTLGLCFRLSRFGTYARPLPVGAIDAEPSAYLYYSWKSGHVNSILYRKSPGENTNPHVSFHF